MHLRLSHVNDEIFICETIEFVSSCIVWSMSWRAAVVRKSQELRPVMTRLPEGLRRRLEREAEQNRRSMNAEIIHRLTQSFVRQDQADLIADTVRQTLAAYQTPVSNQADTPRPLAEAAAQPTEPKPTVETDKSKQEE
jgi:Arc-like DNA binding domain